MEMNLDGSEGASPATIWGRERLQVAEEAVLLLPCSGSKGR
jgi:hypothetical protein